MRVWVASYSVVLQVSRPLCTLRTIMEHISASMCNYRHGNFRKNFRTILTTAIAEPPATVPRSVERCRLLQAISIQCNRHDHQAASERISTLTAIIVLQSGQQFAALRNRFGVRRVALAQSASATMSFSSARRASTPPASVLRLNGLSYQKLVNPTCYPGGLWPDWPSDGLRPRSRPAASRHRPEIER